MSQNFWKEMESLAASTVEAAAPALLGAYLNKTAGVPGAPAMTLGDVGRIAGTVAATAVLQHVAAAQASGSAPQPGPTAS